VSFGAGALLLAVSGLFGHVPTQQLVTRYFEKVVYVSQEYVRAVEQLQESEDEELTALVEALPKHLALVLPALIVSAICLRIWSTISWCGATANATNATLDPHDVTCWRASDYLVWVFLIKGNVTIPLTR
jgi:hypothetical protein